MSHVALVALCLVSATALAQTPASQPVPPDQTAPEVQASEPAVAAQPSTPPVPSEATVKRVVEDELEQAKQELRNEVKAQLSAREATAAFDQEWAAKKTRLELLTLDGYYRVRPMLFQNLDLDRGLDPSGYSLAPRSPLGGNENTQAWADMRLRLEPTINVSEEIAIKMQMDVLDNLAFGGTPETGLTAVPRYQFDAFNETQVPPRAGVNAAMDSIAVKRVYGEVSTPVGIFRFGRMGAHWGLGMQWNDGNCLDCDNGDTVDRFMFVTELFDGIYVAPMIDFNVEGLLGSNNSGPATLTDLSNMDDSHSYNIAIAKRDTERQVKAKLDNGLSILNYGLLFSYRYQSFASTDEPGEETGNRVQRQANIYMPNIWAKYERKAFRVELEAASVIGNIGNRATDPNLADDPTANQSLSMLQFGAVLQSELRLMEEDKLKLGLELGFASGDRAPGFGANPGRTLPASRTDGTTERGDIDGSQFACQRTGGCLDSTINNFVFDRDYFVDMILWRQMVGSVTDAIYVRPSASFEVTPGLNLFASAIYSRAVFPESAPGWNADGTPGSPDLGLEFNAGAQFETDDGFIASVRYGALFPLAGLQNPQLNATEIGMAHAVRGYFGIRF